MLGRDWLFGMGGMRGVGVTYINVAVGFGPQRAHIQGREGQLNERGHIGRFLNIQTWDHQRGDQLLSDSLEHTRQCNALKSAR